MTSEVTAVIKLLDKSIANNNDCLTVYRRMDNWSETIIRNELQNQLKSLLKDCPSKLDGRQINSVAEDIVKEVLTLPFYKKSVGIFVSLDLSNPEGIEVKLKDNLLVVFSDVEIENTQSCGKIFDLKNLFKMTALLEKNLCVYIAKKETKFYELNSEFRLVRKMDNVILEKYEDRFRNKTPGVQGATHGGSAADEKEDKFNKTTLNDVIKNLKEIAKKQNEYKYVIIFVTSEFTGYDDFIMPEFKYYSETEPVIVKKLVSKDESFEPEFRKAVEQKAKELTKQKLDKYKTDIDNLFKTDLKEVVDCAKDSRIHKLYVTEDFKLDGFILTKDLPHLDKVDGSTPTNQLIDWVIRKVIESGGEVFVLDKDTNLIDTEIAARLRY